MTGGGADPAAALSLRENSRAPEVWWRSSYLTLPVVMMIAIAPYSRLTYLLYFALRRVGINDNLWQIGAFGIELLQVAALIAIVICWERRPLSSIGLRRPALGDLGWGILAYPIIGVGSALSFSLLSPGASRSVHSQLAAWETPSTGWRIALAISVPLFEELYFRGYVIERVKEISGSVVVGVLLGTAVDLYIHSTYWDASYVVAIAFAQVALALLYVWRGSVAPCVVAHFLMDAL